MATYDNLPVYKSSYDLLLETFKLVRLFPRDYKYTIGDIIKKEIINMISNIYKANTKKDKSRNIALAREKVEILRTYFRLCKDLEVISLNQFVDINLKIESVSKQLYAWGKSS